MGKKNATGENSKKASGHARKIASAAAKNEAEKATKSKADDGEWAKGAKSSAKKEAEAEKKAELARRKAEREALLKEETESVKKAAKPAKLSKGKQPPAPAAPKRGLDLGQLDEGEDGKQLPALSATGIDDALDALSLTHAPEQHGIERHPERRYKAAYAAYEEGRLPEMKIEFPGLRQNQMKERIRKEFEKHPDNPFNQVTKNVSYDATRDDIKAKKEADRSAIENRLASEK